MYYGDIRVESAAFQDDIKFGYIVFESGEYKEMVMPVLSLGILRIDKVNAENKPLIK